MHISTAMFMGGGVLNACLDCHCYWYINTFIFQAWYTKEFLRNVRRNNVSLPDGPLFLTPTSLYHAFRK